MEPNSSEEGYCYVFISVWRVFACFTLMYSIVLSTTLMPLGSSEKRDGVAMPGKGGANEDSIHWYYESLMKTTSNRGA
jgi:hypothetical protein